MVAALAVSLSMGSSARAEGQSIGLSGFDYASTGYYAFVGWLKPLEGKFDTHNWVLRLWLDRLVYEVDDGSKTVRAHTWGGAVGLTRFFPVGTARVGLGAGFEAREKEYSRPTTLHDDGFKLRPRLELNYNQPLGGPVRLNVIGSTLIPHFDSYGRAQLLYKTNVLDTEIGLSTSGVAGEDYSSWRVGFAFDSMRISETLRLAGGAGVQRREGKTEAYGVITLVVLFGF
ncbi:cellulose biosynthesis protein BcsS [Vineibacter terrae]|nr:cellulose biosynthesis protein BcsS [Vineibacter terrae]